jgi:hypothetical protein
MTVRREETSGNRPLVLFEQMDDFVPDSRVKSHEEDDRRRYFGPDDLDRRAKLRDS